METLAKQAAELALRLSALPAGARVDPETLDALERLAMLVLKEVGTVRAVVRESYNAGERRGMWPAMPNLRRDH